MFLCAGCFLLRAERLLLLLGRPLWRPKDKEIVVFDRKKMYFLSAVNFFTFFVIKTLDPDPNRYPIQPKMPDPDQMNTDPQPYFHMRQ